MRTCCTENLVTSLASGGLNVSAFLRSRPVVPASPPAAGALAGVLGFAGVFFGDLPFCGLASGVASPLEVFTPATMCCHACQPIWAPLWSSCVGRQEPGIIPQTCKFRLVEAEGGKRACLFGTGQFLGAPQDL